MKALASLALLAGLLALQSEAAASPILGKWTSAGVTANGKRHPMPPGLSDRKSTRLNSSHLKLSRMPSSA